MLHLSRFFTCQHRHCKNAPSCVNRLLHSLGVVNSLKVSSVILQLVRDERSYGVRYIACQSFLDRESFNMFLALFIKVIPVDFPLIIVAEQEVCSLAVE